MIVLFNSHFNIKTGIFRQVTMRVRIFSSKDGANFVNTLKIRSNCHLLRELGGLSEERGTSEIVQLENTGARFRGSTLSRSVSVEKVMADSTHLQFRSVDFNKPSFVKSCPKSVAS